MALQTSDEEQNILYSFYSGNADFAELSQKLKARVLWVRSRLSFSMVMFSAIGWILLLGTPFYVVGAIIAAACGYFGVFDRRREFSLALMTLGMAAGDARKACAGIPLPKLVVEVYRTALIAMPFAFMFFRINKNPALALLGNIFAVIICSCLAIGWKELSLPMFKRERD